MVCFTSLFLHRFLSFCHLRNSACTPCRLMQLQLPCQHHPLAAPAALCKHSAAAFACPISGAIITIIVFPLLQQRGQYHNLPAPGAMPGCAGSTWLSVCLCMQASTCPLSIPTHGAVAPVPLTLLICDNDTHYIQGIHHQRACWALSLSAAATAHCPAQSYSVSHTYRLKTPSYAGPM